MQTLYLREVRRFWKVGAQTVAAPVVTTLLYMLVFVVALQNARPPLHGTPFALFVAPGLIMMAMLNNAFANASSSLIQAKIMGTATDFLTPPLSPLELTLASPWAPRRAAWRSAWSRRSASCRSRRWGSPICSP